MSEKGLKQNTHQTLYRKYILYSIPKECHLMKFQISEDIIEKQKWKIDNKYELTFQCEQCFVLLWNQYHC
jgi:hypothetical protein